MAEKGDVPVTLEMIATAGTNSRRRSMGWASSLNSGEKLVPNYLRTSTGSCHDICKYGTNHDLETKSRQPVPIKVLRRSFDGGSSVDSVVFPQREKTGGTLVDSVVIPERKKATTSQIPKNVVRESVDVGCLGDSVVLPERKKTTLTRITKKVARNSLDGGSSVDSVVLPERKKTTLIQITKKVARNSLDGGSSVDSVVLLERKKTTLARMPENVARKSLEGESLVDSAGLSERKKKSSARAKAQVSFTSRKSEDDWTTLIRPKLSVQSSGFPSSLQREVLNEKKKKLLAEPRTLPKSRSTNALKNLKPETSSATRNLENSVVQVVAKAKERKLPEKYDKLLKLKSITVKPLRSAGSAENLKKKYDSKIGKSFTTSKEAAKKVVAASTSSLASNSIHGTANLTAKKHVNLKGVPVKTHNKIKTSERELVRSEEVQEKSLYVIKIENEEIPQQSDQNETDDNMEAVSSSPHKSLSLPWSPSLLANVEDQDVSEYTESEADDDPYSESDEIGSMEADNVSSEGGKKGRSQNLGMLQSKEKDPQSTKLSFRRGKIIDIRSENNSPRRLKFRRARLLGESQRSEDGFRKNFKRGKEADSDTATDQETVVLRHQDVQGKKDAQGLFNNVIEETASKLVETRKSKVKALVGAFETVISLQDGKPSES